MQKINMMTKHRKIALDFSMPTAQNKGSGRKIWEANGTSLKKGKATLNAVLASLPYTDVKQHLLLRSVLRIGQEKKSSAIQGNIFHEFEGTQSSVY